MVIVCVDTKPLGFLINSEIREWLKKDPDRLAAQANVLASEHSALNYDSFVDCWEIYEFEEAELTQARDPVSRTAKLSIKAAVAKSKTVEQKYKTMIRDS